jgi:hypothetical protein
MDIMWNLGKAQVFPAGSSPPCEPREANTPFGSEASLYGKLRQSTSDSALGLYATVESRSR